MVINEMVELSRKPDWSLKVEPRHDDFKPFSHRQHAWHQMDRVFVTDGAQAGIIIIPTGGGKTLLMSRWLTKNHIATGGRVVWLVHRRELVVQAFRSFYECRHLAFPRQTLKLIRISSVDARWSNVDRDRAVVFSTIQSAAAEQNIGFLDRLLNQSPKGVFVVVDEAHHAPAPSYVRVLRMLKDAGAKLIGLTATPVRMNDEETQSLSNLFDGKVLCRVHMRTLIEQGILSTPAIETINTHVEFEREFDESDFEHLTHFRELSPQILDRLAVHGSRNRLIVKHYGKNAEKYGKTLVFAANTLHALTLAKEFQKAGISADYVDYTRRTEDNSSSRYLLQFLGLRRLTNKGREKMKSVFSAAVRQKIVASDGGKIVLLRKTSADSV